MATGTIKKTIPVEITPTAVQTFSSFESRIWKYGNVCSGYLTITNGSGSTLSGGTTVLISGLPAPYEGYSIQILGGLRSGTDARKTIGARINTDGQLQLWYAGDIQNGAAASFPFTYICN